MPVELIKNPLKVCRIVGEDVFSTVVEEDINVPDVSPDLYKIIAPSAVVLVKDCEVLADKVNINGQVLMNILYAADAEGRPLSSMDISANFSQSVEMPGVKPRMKEHINAVVQHVDCMMINSRKLNIKVIMDLNCRVEDMFDLELASDVRGVSDIQVLREPHSFKQVIGYNRDKYDINEELVLASEKPPVAKILKTDFRAILKEDKLSDGKVEVNGILGVSLLYTAADENDSINFAEFDVPFAQYIEVPAADRNMECITDVAVSECYLEALDDENGDRRVLNVNGLLNITSRVFKETEEDVVIDAYSPSSVIDMNKDLCKMNELIGKGRSNVVIKESMAINHGDPEIESVCCINVMPAVNEVKIMDDRVVIEGMMDTTAVYKTSFSAEPMCSMNEQIPFRHFVDIPGAKLGMQPLVSCAVDSVSFSPMNSEMVELRVVLCLNAEVCKQVEKRVVTRIEEAEGVAIDINRIPAVTVYLVQKGDSLWSIAKRYNTTVDELVKLNNIENPSKLAPGSQIMILKSMRVS